MLKIGDSIPSFTAQTTEAKTVRSEDFRGHWTVLYFYPKAFTPICTQETRRFRDNHDDLARYNVRVVGISCDDLSTQCKFGEQNRIQFPLIADQDSSVSRAFGTLWALVGINKRVTFVIDPQGKIAAQFHHEFQVSKHLDDVLHFFQGKPVDGHALKT